MTKYKELINRIQSFLDGPGIRHFGDDSKSYPSFTKGGLDEQLVSYVASLKSELSRLSRAAMIVMYSSVTLLLGCIVLLMFGSNLEISSFSAIVSLLLQIVYRLITNRERRLRDDVSNAEEFISSLMAVDVLMEFTDSIDDPTKKDVAKADLLRDLPDLLLRQMPRWRPPSQDEAA
ncbi:MAG: hypothetical protein V3V99_14740 [candidate division Zixibacteria bacterium]